jgi:hypothetical protein
MFAAFGAVDTEAGGASEDHDGSSPASAELHAWISKCGTRQSNDNGST